MTTIYVPRLIETAEQAEALPVGTVADSTGNLADPEDVPFVKMSDGDWLSPWESCSNEECEDYPDCGQISYALYKNSHMVGKHALVPIEAEEEFTTRSPGGTRYPSTTRNKALVHVEMSPGVVMESRYVTPWEEA